MSDTLFNFIYSTLRARANDPTNQRFWLPTRLLDLDNPDGTGKLLPLNDTDWSPGALTGDGGTTIRNSIAASWWGLATSPFELNKANPSFDPTQFQPIACPSSPWPILTLPTVQVDGLQNIWLCPDPLVAQPGDGYTTTLTLQFGYYDGEQGRPKLPALQVSGTYQMVQCVCAASNSNPSQCTSFQTTLPNLSWPSQTITGTGKMALGLADVYVDAVITLRMSAQQTVDVGVETVTVRGPQPGQLPTFTLEPDALTIDSGMSQFLVGTWKEAVIEAFGHEETHKVLAAKLNDALNESGNRGELASVLTQQLASVFNSVLGPVSGSLPPDTGQQSSNPVDQYLFDRVRVALGNPASTYYLPQVVAGSHDPQMEPVQVDEISLGDVSLGDGLPTLQDLRLNGVTVVGTSNVAAPPDTMIFKPYGIDATLVLSTLNPPPQVTITRGGVQETVPVPAPPLTVAGAFSMASPDGDGSRLGGSFTLTVTTSTVAAAMALSGSDLDSLDLQFTSLTLDAAPADTQVTLHIDSAFNDIIQTVLNGADVKQKVLAGVNQQVQDNLASISSSATADVRRIVAAQLNG